MINIILIQAIKIGASDIHLEPFEKTARIRFRIDGVLYPQKSPPRKEHSPFSYLHEETGSYTITPAGIEEHAKHKRNLEHILEHMYDEPSYTLDELSNKGLAKMRAFAKKETGQIIKEVSTIILLPTPESNIC